MISVDKKVRERGREGGGSEEEEERAIMNEQRNILS
jgi:hypothetical protein